MPAKTELALKWTSVKSILALIGGPRMVKSMDVLRKFFSSFLLEDVESFFSGDREKIDIRKEKRKQLGHNTQHMLHVQTITSSTDKILRLILTDCLPACLPAPLVVELLEKATDPGVSR